MNRKSVRHIALAMLLAMVPLNLDPVQAAGKPGSPLSLSISPMQPDLSPEAVKPGEVVQLKIEALSRIDLAHAVLRVVLSGGARLVAGSDRWQGSLKKGLPVVLILTVAAPENGRGRVIATVSSGGFRGTAAFVLGPEQVRQQDAAPRRRGAEKADHRGDPVIEFR